MLALQQLALVLALSLVYSSIEATGKIFEAVDPDADLEWKRSPVTKNVSTSQDVTRSIGQIELPSSTELEATLVNPIMAPTHREPFLYSHENNNDNNQEQEKQLQLQLAASRLLGQLMNLPEGKRRLDDDGAVTLASNQQWRANRYRQPALGADDIVAPRRQQKQQFSADYRGSNISNRRQLQSAKEEPPLSGRRSSSGRRPSSSSASKMRQQQQLNYNYDNADEHRGQVAASRRQQQQQQRQLRLQPRMAANNRNGAAPQRARANSRDGRAVRANKEDNERTPSDEEIFNDDETDDESGSSSERRSDSNNDDYDESSDDSSSSSSSDPGPNKGAPVKRVRSTASGGRSGSSSADSPLKSVSGGQRRWSSVESDAAEALRYNDENGSNDQGAQSVDRQQGYRQSIGMGQTGVSDVNQFAGRDEGAEDSDDSLSATQQRSFTSQPQQDLQVAAGHQHGHHHGHYYQYVEVPKKKSWKFGFKRGNHKHESEY